jgi:hypothetical protein
MRERRVFLYALAFELILGVIGVLGGALTGAPALADFRWELRAPTLGLALTLPLLAWFALSWRSERPALREIRVTLERLLPDLLGGLGWPALLGLSLAAGLGEEILFRGFVQGSLERATGPAVGLIAASAVFGLAHAITRTYALVATLMALYLGAAWRLGGNLLVPITIHAAYDAVVIWTVLSRAVPERRAAD